MYDNYPTFKRKDACTCQKAYDKCQCKPDEADIIRDMIRSNGYNGCKKKYD